MADLKSGGLYWNAINPHRFIASKLDCNIKCDALIVGSGITGAFIAHRLGTAGIDTVVVDKGEIGQGSTPASTALVQYEIDTPLVELAEMRGTADATAAYTACYAAVRDIELLANKLGIASRTQKRGSLFLGASEDDRIFLLDESIKRQGCGIECEYIDRESLITRFRIDRPCGLFSPRALEVDPVALTDALHQSSQRAGVRYFKDTEVAITSIWPTGPRLRASHGPEIQAGKVIFASGYEIPAVLRANVCKYRSTYALATEPVGEDLFWPARCMIWEHADPYFYIRSTPDNRILIGGEDIDDSDAKVRDRLIPKKAKALLDKLSALFPWLSPKPAYQWAGTFAVTNDGLPFVGTVPELPRCEFSLGYGGNGITFSFLAAQIIKDKLLSRVNPMQHLFAFNRSRKPAHNLL